VVRACGKEDISSSQPRLSLLLGAATFLSNISLGSSDLSAFAGVVSVLAQVLSRAATALACGGTFVDLLLRVVVSAANVLVQQYGDEILGAHIGDTLLEVARVTGWKMFAKLYSRLAVAAARLSYNLVPPSVHLGDDYTNASAEAPLGAPHRWSRWHYVSLGTDLPRSMGSGHSRLR